MGYKILVGICLLLLLASSLIVNSTPQIEIVMEKLVKSIAEEQVLKQIPYRFPQWEQKLGLYRSEIRIDFFGEELVADLRSNKFVYVFDNNMFATGWIASVLLEANMYGRAPKTIDNEHLSLAIDAIETFHDRNQNDSSVPLMTFWSQTYNKSSGAWVSTPDNLRSLIDGFDGNLKLLEDLLRAIGIRKIAELIDKVKGTGESIETAFQIPPDFDDTYLNIGLGVQLKLSQDKYPSLYPRWVETNTNMKKLVELTTRYAYRPSSSDPNENMIDPRTYFWIRNFVRDNADALIATTWAQNIDEVRYLAHRGVRMPFNLNNVDVTVGANVVYGITSAYVYELLDFKDNFNKDMENLYRSTASLIAWAIKNNMQGRPDLAQVYYPSHYNFLWYGSRTLFLLELVRRNGQSLPDVFNQVYLELADAYRNDAVKYFEEHVRSDSASYDDFLGVNDTNIFGKTQPTGEDRIFSTAQTVNVLLASFTYFNTTSATLQWISNDPKVSTVKAMVDRSVSWLINNAFKYKPYNCFFSGSVKGYNELPFWYPANSYQFLNGTKFNPDTILASQDSLTDTIVGVSGYVNEDDYQRMINQKHFNMSTPTTFNGYNVPKGEFPFWSSQPYTHAVTLLALAQYNNLS